MKTSWNGRAFLAREEGAVLSAYRDSVGVWTIGIGHTSSAGEPKPVKGLRLSLEQVLALFARDLEKYEAGVNRAIKVPLHQHQFDALVSFHFNTGAIARASLTERINERNFALAARAMMLWKRPPEIIGRRTRERKLFETGDYGDLSGLSVWQNRSGRPQKMQFPPPLIDPGPPPAPPPDHVPVPPKPPSARPTGRQTAIGALIAAIVAAFVGLAKWLGLI